MLHSSRTFWVGFASLLLVVAAPSLWSQNEVAESAWQGSMEVTSGLEWHPAGAEFDPFRGHAEGDFWPYEGASFAVDNV